MILMTVFGAIWWLAGSSTFGVPLRLAGVVVSIALLIVAWRQNRSPQPGLPAGVDTAKIMRQFNLIGAVEGFTILIVVIGCIASGHPNAIAALVCLVVGVHFLPLAGVFHVRLYVVTGMALIGIAVVTLVAGAIGEWSDALWLGVPAIAAAVVLWVTAAALPMTGVE
jgi:hypothetical protein